MGRKRGVSLSPTPPLLQRQPLSLSEKRHYLQKKSPLDTKRSGLWPGKATPSPRRVLGQCILIAALLWRLTKRDRPGAAAGQGEWAWAWVGEPGEANPGSPLRQPLSGLTSLCLESPALAGHSAPITPQDSTPPTPRTPVLVGVRSGVEYTGGFAWKPVLSGTSLTEPSPPPPSSHSWLHPSVCVASALSLGVTQCGGMESEAESPGGSREGHGKEHR